MLKSLISQYFNLIQNSYLIIFNLSMEKPTTNPFVKNVHRIQQALAQAERIPIGGISNYPSTSEILKSRLLGLENFSKDKRNTKTFQIPKNQKNSKTWNNFVEGRQKVPSIYNQMEDKYKQKFMEFRNKMMSQSQIGGINKGGYMYQPNRKKQAALHFGMGGPFDRISNELGKNSTGLFTTEKPTIKLPQTNNVFGVNNNLSGGVEKPKVNIFSPSYFDQKPTNPNPTSTKQADEKESAKKSQEINSQGIKFPILPNKPVDIFSKKLEVAESDRPVLVTTNKLFAEGNPWGQFSEAPKQKGNIFFNSNIQNKNSGAQQKQKVKEIGASQQDPLNQQTPNENQSASKEKKPIFENNMFSMFSNKSSNNLIKANQQVSLIAQKKTENATPQLSLKPLLQPITEKSNIFMNSNNNTQQKKQEFQSWFSVKNTGNNQSEKNTLFTPFSNPQSEMKDNIQSSVFGGPSTASLFGNTQFGVFGQKEFAKIPINEEMNVNNKQSSTLQIGFKANDSADGQRKEVKQQNSGQKQQSPKEKGAPIQKGQNAFGNSLLTPFFKQNQEHKINIIAPKGESIQSSSFSSKSLFDNRIKQDEKQGSQGQVKLTPFLGNSTNQVKSSLNNQSAEKLTPKPFGSQQSNPQPNFMNAEKQRSFMSLTPVNDEQKEEKKDKIMFGMQSPSALFGKKMQEPEKKPNASQILNSFAQRPLTPGNIFSGMNNNKLQDNNSNSQGLFASSNNGLFSQQNSSSPFGSTLQNTLFSNQDNTKKDNAEEGDDDDDHDSQLQKEQQDNIDPSKSTGNHQYDKSDILFKDVAVKLRKGTADTVQNMTVSIQKIPEHTNKILFVRMPNKQYYFYGTIMKGITEVNPLKSSRNISIKKIVFTTEQKKTNFEALKIQFKDENIGNKFLQTLKDN